MDSGVGTKAWWILGCRLEQIAHTHTNIRGTESEVCPRGVRGAQHHPALSFQGNIVVLVHSSEDGADEENDLLGTALSHHSDLILWAEGLATGFCKDIHGEVTDQRGLQGLLEPPAPCGCGGDVSVRSCPLETSHFCGGCPQG